MKHALKVVLILMIGFSCTSINAFAAPSTSADQAILMEAESGRILYENNSHQEQKIASITKIMTAHLAIQHGDLDELVKISPDASVTEGSSLYLKAGQKVSLLDLVYGLLLRSGNDSAVAIAEHVSGSVDDFAKLMNKEAKRIGMKNTHFTNPHGLDLDNEHYSSAFDMALLTQEAIKDKTFAEIFGTTSHRATSLAPSPTWSNKHRLVTGMYPHATGGKTGFTRLAGRTLVTTAKRDDMSLIVVTIRASSDWNDHMNLFEYGFSHYKNEQILHPDILPPFPGQSENEFYTLTEPFSYPLTSEEKSKLTIEGKIPFNRNTPPIVYVKLDEEIIHKQELVREVRSGGFTLWNRIVDKLKFWQDE
ncbi:D-alanyl-D-alanine carboxypeptidase family protein [Jeotgalibacillus proteolyticus]|uniref:D-alanyl-D-alanine carboxypeptidase family protein n=1 Tax=Jeotgalibacillus proteolyticus TaxID=2082395 RepID=UPI001AD9AAE7|nr:D-alanyl-D-alanine carboxypeptidase family protein [Jeotgalibacillus proteolyticus]